MRYVRKLSAGVLTLATVLSITVSVAPEAVAIEPPACAAELGISEIPDPASAASKIPVVTVHGWSSGSGALKALGDVLESIPDTKVQTFNYETVNTRWVTDPEIGQRLAKTIVCYSKLYKNRLILVAHSMGSLASREALSWADAGVFAKNVVGHAVTIGAPHLGTALANADAEFWLSVCKSPFGPSPIMAPLFDGPCREIESTRATSGMQIGSDQLEKLAKFPPNISVKAIAGDVAWRVCAPWGCAKTDTGGDLVVSIPSATNQFTDMKKGDGKTVFTCETAIPFSPVTDAWCDHNKMLNASQVQQEVKKSIEDYIASTRKPAVPMTNFFGLQLPLGAGWEVLKAPDDIFPNERKIVVSKKGCGPQDFKMYCSGFVVAKMGGADPKVPYKAGVACNYNWVHDDLGWSSPKVIGPVTVGGIQGEHFTQENVCKLEDGGRIQRKGDILHGWRFPSKGIVVYDSEGTDRFSSNPFPGVEQLLQSATWR